MKMRNREFRETQIKIAEWIRVTFFIIVKLYFYKLLVLFLLQVSAD